MLKFFFPEMFEEDHYVETPKKGAHKKGSTLHVYIFLGFVTISASLGVMSIIGIALYLPYFLAVLA